MTILSIPPLVMSVVALYVCAYHLLVFLRRPKQRLDLAFALTCLAVGLYDICCVGNYNSPTPAVGVQWQRMQLLTLSLVTTAFLWFVVSYTSMKPGRRRIPVYLFSLFFLSAAVVQAVYQPGPNGFTWTDQEAVKSFAIPFVGWPVTYNEMSQGPFTDFHAFSFLVAYLYLFWVTFHFYWKGNPRKAVPLLLAILIFFAGIFEDVMVTCEFYNFVYTIEYGFIGMLLVMSYALSNELVDAALTKRALQESEDKFRSLVEASSDWIWEVDQDGRYTYASPKVRDVLGYDPQEVVGKTVFDFMPPEEAERVREFFANKARTQQPLVALENVNLHMDGRRVVLETSGVPIVDASGTLVGYRGVDRDITDRKQAEEERDRLEEQLRQAQKMEAIGQLAGGIAHDFNNILTAIMGNAELLKMDLPPTGEQTERADEIIKGAARAADLTSQLLAFARKGKWQVVPVDIHNIVNQTVSMLTHTIDRRIEIHLELHASPSTIMGDPTQLHSAMLNLGVNARDAMTDGGTLTYATRCVTLTRADCDEHPYELTPGSFLEIRITDTGVGMDQQTQKRVFEPFFTTKEVGKGTGLGLAGVYGCVRSHDGSVSVSSEPGRGTTFTILLPLADTDASATERTVSSGEPVRGTGHVLVVDDEKSVRSFVQTSLQNLGYTVSVCPDGAAGADYYREHHKEIDLVILDLIMPKMSGQDAFEEMKRINANVRVLVSSGFSHTQATRQMLDDGALGILNKPFQITELARAVAEHIHRNSR